MSSLDNANPTVHSTGKPKRLAASHDLFSLDTSDLWDREQDSGNDASDDNDGEEELDQNEIFDLIRGITDPEHPLTLEQLAVVSAKQIHIQHGRKPRVLIEFTPTIPHCSMATLIGLSIRVRMLRALPEKYKVDIRVQEGSHASEHQVNRQLNDKERVAAALENTHLLEVVQNCLATAGGRGEVSAHEH